MFRLLPVGRRGWLRAVLFPFQAYGVIAFVVLQYFASNWPRHTRWGMTDLKLHAISGYAICFVVLLLVGLAQLFTGHRCSGCLNLGLAAFTALLCIP